MGYSTYHSHSILLPKSQITIFKNKLTQTSATERLKWIRYKSSQETRFQALPKNLKQPCRHKRNQ